MVSVLRYALFALTIIVCLSLTASVSSSDDLPPSHGTPPYSITDVNGLSVVALSGSAHDIGYQHGLLLYDRFVETEAAFEKIMPPIPLGWLGEIIMRWYVMMKLEDIEGYLAESEVGELKGLESAHPDPDRDYRDLLYYHVLQDMGQYYACTGGAVFGGRSATGGPTAGRNFDMNKDGVLDKLKTVYYIRPDFGADYVSIAWPGMVGAVSGMNEYGVAVMEFSAKSEDAELEGVPVAFILKRVLLNARNVDEAVEIVEGLDRMGPNIFLVADKDRAVAIEFDSENVLVREAPDGMLTAANHFTMPPLSDDEKNIAYIGESDTMQRYVRMEALLDDNETVGGNDIASMLRDHAAQDGAELVWDDPAAINNTKCAHSVIFDTRALTFWVAKAPMAYGEYVGLRMTSGGLIPVDTIPASEYSHPEADLER
jgi:predicted choloylglycine hydrolase